MALPPIAKATLQSALINAGSNVLAQGIKAYRAEVPFTLDIQTLYQFTTCAFILSPVTFLWLEGLEASFPGEETVPKGNEKEKRPTKLNIPNTIAKILIDQILGGALNTALYIVTLGTLRGQDYDVIQTQLQNDFWPIMIAGFKLWPLVSILNFTVVPADKRLLVGSLFGVIWAVYLSLLSGYAGVGSVRWSAEHSYWGRDRGRGRGPKSQADSCIRG